MSSEMAQAGVRLGLSRSEKGLLFLGFFGGEPLLEAELLFETLSYAKAEARRQRKKVYFSLTTNATRVTQALASRLAEEKVQIAVSLDGSSKLHDLSRKQAKGNGSHKEALAGFKLLQKTALHPKIISVVRPQTVAQMSNNLRYFYDIGASYVVFSLDYSAAWTPKDRAQLRESAMRLGRSYRELSKAGKRIHVEPFATKILLAQDWWRRSRHQCGFGLDELAVAPNGDLYPCERMVSAEADTQHRIGSLAEGLDTEAARTLHQASRTLPECCRVCPLLKECARHCGCSNLAGTGDAGLPSDFFCFSEQVFIQTTRHLSKESSSKIID